MAAISPEAAMAACSLLAMSPLVAVLALGFLADHLRALRPGPEGK